MSLTWDWETKGVIDLKKRGAYVYAGHPLTDALIASFKLKPEDSAATRAWIATGGPVNVICRWRRGESCPPYVRAYIEAGGELRAYNCSFERLIWQMIMTPRHGWPALRLEQCRCTAVTAAAMSLPRDLERLGDALDLKIKKDKRGKDLMKIHSIPIGFAADGSAIWHALVDNSISLAAYHDYCDFDVLSEEEADSRLIPLSDEEMRIYWLNERINDHGLRIDVVSARAALRLIAAAKTAIDAEMTETTAGVVTAATQAARLKRWCETQGVTMPSMDKDDVDEFLHGVDDLPVNVRRALELRAEGAKPSVDKIGAMLDRVGPDGRARGVYLHHGAGQTGRFSSRGVQAHNMPKYRKLFEDAHLDQATLFQVIRSGDPALLIETYGPDLGRPLHLLSDAVRGFIWAEPGHEMLVADYSSIEGRMAAWFAGEEWELEAYRALDRGVGPGIYELNASDMYQIDVKDVTKAQRKGGKVRALSCAYQTGAGGIRKFARQEKIKLPPLYPALWAVADDKTRAFVEKRFAERVTKHDPNCAALGREGWIAAELIKIGWRNKHPRIIETWRLLEEAAIAAVASPGERFDVIGCIYLVAHGFLWCRLPSGRCLAYGKPKMAEVEAPWADPTVEPIRREKKLSLTVRGVDAVTEKWTRFPVYGGSLFNNVVQGSARDVLVAGMLKAETRYGTLTGHTHDELFVEVPRGAASIKEFERLICDLPPWCVGLPLTAAGFTSKRYKKA
jgi:DNA polymerase bacteriophage-type